MRSLFSSLLARIKRRTTEAESVRLANKPATPDEARRMDEEIARLETDLAVLKVARECGINFSHLIRDERGAAKPPEVLN